MKWRVADREVDVSRVEIHHDGQPIAVQRQVFAVIEYLVRHRERVVSKEELLDSVWGDRFVTPSALTSRIKSARRALGDDGQSQAVIKTVHGHGYRLVADVEEIVESSPTESSAVRPRTSASDARVDWPMVGRRSIRDEVLSLFDAGSVGGVVLSGPVGAGASRLANEVLEAMSVRGTPTARVIGSPAAANIPLAAVGHLLTDGFQVDGGTTEYAVGAAFQRVRAAITDRYEGARPVVVVDAVDHLDDMTVAVVESLLADQGIFAVIAVSHHPSTIDVRFSTSVEAGRLREFRLTPLTETDVDILLYRMLPGPISADALERLMAASSGWPGPLRDIVESTKRSGGLVSDDGVWRLAGPLTSSALLDWDEESLSEDAARGAEILALLPRAPIEFATAVLGDEAIDELDSLGLLAVDRDRRFGTDDGIRVSISDPLLVSAITTRMRPLRASRLKDELTGEVLVLPDPQLLAAVVGWGDEHLARLGRRSLIDAAGLSLYRGDVATAGTLLDGVDETPTDDGEAATVAVMRGEVALSRGQWNVAADEFSTVNVDVTDDGIASQVLRRRATIQFYARGEYQSTVDALDRAAIRYGGRVGEALRARQAGLCAHVGDVGRVFEITDGLPDHRGLTALEVALSRSTALMMSGSTSAALELLDELAPRIGALPEVWRTEFDDGLLGTRCTALVAHGSLSEASTMVRTHLPIGRRPLFGFLPSVAAEVEAAAGRPRAAVEILRSVLRTGHQDDFPQYRTIARATEIAARFQIDPDSVSAVEIDDVLAEADRVLGELQWLCTYRTAAPLCHLGQADRAARRLVAVGQEAHSFGATTRVAVADSLRILLDLADDAHALAAQTRTLTSSFDGPLWPLVVDHLVAHVADDQRELVSVADRYESLGYLRQATMIRS